VEKGRGREGEEGCLTRQFGKNLRWKAGRGGGEGDKRPGRSSRTAAKKLGPRGEKKKELVSPFFKRKRRPVVPLITTRISVQKREGRRASGKLHPRREQREEKERERRMRVGFVSTEGKKRGRPFCQNLVHGVKLLEGGESQE